MKNKLSLFMGLILGLTSTQSFAANSGDASEVNMKIYKMWVSPNSNCSGMSLVYTDDNPTPQNMMASPTLGTGTVAPGTYNCIAFKMSEIITAKPSYNSDHGHCTTGSNLTVDVFRNPSTSACPDGTSITGTSSLVTEDKPCLFLSVTGTTNNSVEPWNAASPFLLNNPFVVTGDTAGTFVADFRGKISDTGAGIGGECEVEPPVFSFR
ncbi:MAG: hypothetical protein ACKVQC_09195 [Elusimicrobiota bacterium]